MNRYILIPEDTIRVLPPEDGVEAAIEIFCSRTVIYFEIAQILDVCLMHNVLTKCGRADALLLHGGGPPAWAGTDGARPHGPGRLCTFSQDSGHMRRKRWIFPKRQIISRSPATTTAIIAIQQKKPHILKEKEEVQHEKA